MHDINEVKGDVEELINELHKKWSPIAQPTVLDAMCVTTDTCSILVQQQKSHAKLVVITDTSLVSVQQKKL